jgi:23S rRNA pseudouridine1911/1915/1917 synthase
MRLDAYLASAHPEHSRSTWQKYIKAGYVSVDGQVTTDFDTVSEDSKVEISIPKLSKRPLDLPVIYEDDNVIVIDKPVGVLTHSKGALNDEFTVADFVKVRSDLTLANQTFPAKARLGLAAPHPRPSGGLAPAQALSEKSGPQLLTNDRFGIVHRLDRATSGVIISAKTGAARKFLQKQFSDRKAKKTYFAVVEKTPKESAARIDLPIGRDPKHPSKFRVDPKGKPAVTDYKLVQVLPGGRALLELKPLTGRTHQLRVHLAYIGAPIVGDPVYGSTSTARATLAKTLIKTGAERMMLHAAELEITIPGGERKTFTAKLPKEFEK